MKKKFQIVLAAFLLSFSLAPQMDARKEDEIKPGSDPLGTVSYCLPRTTLSFEVEAVMESFYAGPYARFASKYLGVVARTADETTHKITKVGMSTKVEADQESRFFLSAGTDDAYANMLKLSSQGLVSLSDGASGDHLSWTFPSTMRGDFSDRGVTANLTSESAVLYQNTRSGKFSNTVAVQQNLVVEKSLEKRAAETADMIFRLRDQRIRILTGDTDATYSGEAMAAALNELESLEKEYLSLFIGYSEFQTKKMRFDLVPEKGDTQKYIAFRISDKDGLLPSDDIAGKPVLMEIIPEEIATIEYDKKVRPTKGPVIWYRIPSVCKVRLMNGTDLILNARVPVYQLGMDTSFPINLHVE